jgi:hypothetical protein
MAVQFSLVCRISHALTVIHKPVVKPADSDRVPGFGNPPRNALRACLVAVCLARFRLDKSAQVHSSSSVVWMNRIKPSKQTFVLPTKNTSLRNRSSLYQPLKSLVNGSFTCVCWMQESWIAHERCLWGNVVSNLFAYRQSLFQKAALCQGATGVPSGSRAGNGWKTKGTLVSCP